MPEGAPESWDLADPLPEGWTRETIKAALQAARAVEPDAAAVHVEQAADRPHKNDGFGMEVSANADTMLAESEGRGANAAQG